MRILCFSLQAHAYISSFGNSVREVYNWRDRTTDDIITSYDGTIYDSPHVDTRRVVDEEDLWELDGLDEDQEEIPIYTAAGYRIPRRLATFEVNTLSHGVLVDLRNIGTVFQSNDFDDLFDDEDDITPTQYFVYPQAGLVTAGHFQANSLFNSFQPLLNQLNDDLRQELDVPDHHSPPAIVGISCQGYNAVMHSTRGRSAQHHEAQRGLITSTLAGAWADSFKTKNRAERLKHQCSTQLPHVDFRHKISRDAIGRDLRLENVFSIDIQQLPNHMKDGRQVTLSHPLILAIVLISLISIENSEIIESLILPLGMMWTHPSVFNQIKHHVLLLRPEVCPTPDLTV